MMCFELNSHCYLENTNSTWQQIICSRGFMCCIGATAWILALSSPFPNLFLLVYFFRLFNYQLLPDVPSMIHSYTISYR